MKIQYCSDLHLEFESNRNWFKKNPLTPNGEILIIAGDTYYLNKNFEELDFINEASKDFEAVYLIPGNHEYYGGFDVSTALSPTCKEIKKNVFLVNNYSVDVKGIRLIFSTMWSKIEKNILEVMRGMVDFRRIKYGTENFTINHFNELHNKAFEFLKAEVENEEKKIIITHHLPSYQCNAEEFKSSTLNEAFCVEKTDFISANNIDYWIYGHSHRNINEFEIGKTKMITNQFGYVQWNEHRSFDYSKVLEI